MEKVIAQGAEAVLIHKNNELIKKRIRKGYRHPELDLKLRKSRTKKEAKIFEKAKATANVPEIKHVDNWEIEMEFIDGKVLSEWLDKFSLKESLGICRQIGSEIAKLHDKDIIHGDLTTSNMIFHNKKVYFVDFGLGFISTKVEDKAVDLHLLKQAFESKHFEHWSDYYKEALNSYKGTSKNAKGVFARLEKVEERGRYKKKAKRAHKEKNI